MSYICEMKRLLAFIVIFASLLFTVNGQERKAEDYYEHAFNEIVSMLEGRIKPSIKRAVFLAEWAYYEGKLDYQKDFCDEIDRITAFLRKFYAANHLERYKTGKQIALNDYFFRPWSGNGYKPYRYDYNAYRNDDDNWENQFVSRVLKTHNGQCRSLPWLYKILAAEIGADVHIAYAPRHCYIKYQDLDSLTPEPWINLELTSQQMQPAWWIKQDFEIQDSAVIVGTYMRPLDEIETISHQLSDLAFGYYKKFKRYDNFTLKCSTIPLTYSPKNPVAIIIRGHSLDTMLQEHLNRFGQHYNREFVDIFANQIYTAQEELRQTYYTEVSESMAKRMDKYAEEGEKLLNQERYGK